MRPKLPPRKTLVRIGAHANVDERTVRAYLLGTKKTVPAIADLIEASAKAMGIDLEVRP